MGFYQLVCLDRGNYVGQLPYTVGAVCSGCPPDASNCVDGLCCKFVHDK